MSHSGEWRYVGYRHTPTSGDNPPPPQPISVFFFKFHTIYDFLPRRPLDNNKKGQGFVKHAVNIHIMIVAIVLQNYLLIQVRNPLHMYLIFVNILYVLTFFIYLIMNLLYFYLYIEHEERVQAL